MIIDMDQTSAGRAYQWLASTVTPRPVAWVSTLSAEGQGNLAPFSFFQVITGDPPTVMISPLHRDDGGLKDTVLNIQASGEFTISLVPFALVDAMNECSVSYPHGVSEFAQAGVAPADSTKVKPPRVAASPVSLECVAVQCQPYPADKPSCHLILGRVVALHVDEAVLDENGRVDPARLDLVSRMGGDWYGRTSAEANFKLGRPHGWDQARR